MKNVYAVMVAMLVVCSSCQRSQFATTTRISKNGRVTYTRSYPYEKRKLSKAISHKKEIVRYDTKKLLIPETASITPVTGIHSENLIASSTREPAFTLVKGENDQFITNQKKVNRGNLHPDTLVKDNKIQARQEETRPAENRKVEKYGLAGFILSIPGLVPIICLPLAILGVIFGIISLRKIKRNPNLYKGKGFAIASIILGIIGILGILLFIG